MKRYYSARNRPKTLTLEDFQWKVQHLYLFFSEKDYFKGKAGITGWILPKEIEHKAAMALGFQPFPIKQWRWPSASNHFQLSNGPSEAQRKIMSSM